MSPDEVRTSFEKLMPLPNGVSWDGDHYVYDRNVIGSARNATTWAEMLRGYRLAFIEPRVLTIPNPDIPVAELERIKSKLEALFSQP